MWGGPSTRRPCAGPVCRSLARRCSHGSSHGLFSWRCGVRVGILDRRVSFYGLGFPVQGTIPLVVRAGLAPVPVSWVGSHVARWCSYQELRKPNKKLCPAQATSWWCTRGVCLYSAGVLKWGCTLSEHMLHGLCGAQGRAEHSANRLTPHFAWPLFVFLSGADVDSAWCG